jgi:hypothetical protein
MLEMPDPGTDSGADQASTVRSLATFAGRTDLAFEVLNQFGQRTEDCVNAIGEFKAKGILDRGVLAQPTL